MYSCSKAYAMAVTSLKVGDVGVYKLDETGRVGCMTECIGKQFTVNFVDVDGYVVTFPSKSETYYIYFTEVSPIQNTTRHLPWL